MTRTTVSDVMSTPMLTIAADTPVSEAAHGMLEAGIKSIVVVGEDCHPEGIFTSTDAVRVAADATPADEATVDEYMTTDVETVGPDEPLAAVAGRMVDDDVSHLPVTDADGAGLGILTTTDLTEALSTTDTPVQ
jgi:predicted transcriptional regulator